MATVCWASALLSLLLVLLSAPVDGGAPARPVVRTRQGAVRGTTKQANTGRQYLAFYNLPFAKPPVGPLRFRDPQPPESWVHVRDASVKGPSCTQIPFPATELLPIGTEDCLYLNVFTPKLKPTKLLPVMLWIHGGGFMNGAAAWYEVDFLLEHDIVLVSINYRLGALGFLSTGDDAAPGNFGLKDQVAALRWVKENIETFGGDPGSVTIFGESAGGASVHYLMLSPLTKGLFHRAISQSGVAVSPWALPVKDAAEKARKAAAHVGCPTEPTASLVDCLRKVDEFELIATENLFLEWGIFPLIPYRPAVESQRENSFLSKHPADVQPHTSIPWLIGVTKDEGCIATIGFLLNKTMKEELEKYSDKLIPMSLQYHTSPKADLISKKIRDFYFPSGELSISKQTELYSDALFTWTTDAAIRKYKDSAPVYYYLFSYKGKYRITDLFGAIDEDLGVSHADDLLYLFSNTTYIPTSPDRPEKDEEVIKSMTTLWTEFAKTGNPTPNNEPLHWPRVTSDDELEYLEIGQKLEVKKGLFQERVDFWRSLPLRERDHQNERRDEF